MQEQPHDEPSDGSSERASDQTDEQGRLASVDETLSRALATCHQALADHQAGLLSDEELRRALLRGGLVQRPDAVLLLDLESGRWQRYDGITISECPAPVRKTDVARWKQVVRSLQPSEAGE